MFRSIIKYYCLFFVTAKVPKLVGLKHIEDSVQLTYIITFDIPQNGYIKTIDGFVLDVMCCIA